MRTIHRQSLQLAKAFALTKHRAEQRAAIPSDWRDLQPHLRVSRYA
jgi:hypothetical protein